MSVRLAVLTDIPAIDAMRRAYFGGRREPLQSRLDAVWWVATRSGRVVACAALEDILSERVVHDLYRVDGLAGGLGIAALVREIESMAFLDRRNLRFATPLDVPAWNRHLIDRSYRPIGILWGKEWTACRQPQPLPVER